MAATTYKILGVGAIVWISVAVTWWQTDAHWQRKWLERDTAEQKQQLENAAKVAAKEHAWQQQYAALDADYQEKLKVVNDEADRTISNYKRGNLRLRASLNCAAGNMPDVATPSGVSDAAAKCGLSAGDVEFLIRYAERANATAKQLAAAQSLLRIIYHQP